MPYTKEQSRDLDNQTFAYLEVERTHQVLNITLNRPRKKNALHPVMVNELAFALSHARYEPEVWAVVIRAKGDVFCAGADLKAFMGATEEPNSSIPAPPGEILISELFHKLYKPCIALVEKNVYAGGMLILAGCTHIIAGSDVTFGLPEVKRGLFPFQVMAALIEILPPRKVLDWCIRGYDLGAEEALAWGLVTQVTLPEKTETILEQLLKDILANSPTAIQKGLEAFDHLRQQNTVEQQRYLSNMLMQTLQTKDAREGLAAFREKGKGKKE